MKTLSNLAIVVFMILIALSANAQKNQIDSLQLVLKNKSAKNQVKITGEIIGEIAVKYTEINVDSAILYYHRMLEFSKKHDLKKLQVQALSGIGNLYENKKKSIDSILSHFNKALIVNEKLEDKTLKSRIINNIGLAYYNTAQYDKALKQFYKALSIAKKDKKNKEVLRAYKLIGAVFFSEQKFEKALLYFQKGEREAAKYNERKLQANFINNNGAVYYSLDKIDSALICFEKSVELLEQNNQNRDLSLTLLNIARINNTKGNFKLAQIYTNKAIQVAEKINYGNGLIYAYELSAQVAYEKKQYLNAIKYAEQGLSVATQLDRPKSKMDIYKTLKNIYLKINNYEAALKVYEQYEILEDSIFQLDKEKQIDALTIEYEVAQKETENKLLKSEKTNADRIIRNQTVTAIALGLALLFALAWGIVSYRANQRKKQLNQMLEQKVAERTAELQTANKNLEQANYELRTFNYIASHDIKEPIRVIGGYSGLIFKQLPNKLREQLGDYFDTIGRSTKQLYTLVEDFAYYSTLSKDEMIKTEPVDLNLLIYNVIDNLKESIKKYNGEVLVNNLPTINSNNAFLFTALKNLIENGLKYNKNDKPTVKIDYSQTESHYQITVSDNGIGIDKQYHEQIFEMFKRLHNRGAYEGSGIGLAIVKLVTEKLNGTVKIESEAGKGSRFIIRLPIS